LLRENSRAMRSGNPKPSGYRQSLSKRRNALRKSIPPFAAMCSCAKISCRRQPKNERRRGDCMRRGRLQAQPKSARGVSYSRAWPKFMAFLRDLSFIPRYVITYYSAHLTQCPHPTPSHAPAVQAPMRFARELRARHAMSALTSMLLAP
jgi:hypothetical protein